MLCNVFLWTELSTFVWVQTGVSDVAPLEQAITAHWQEQIWEWNIDYKPTCMFSLSLFLSHVVFGQLNTAASDVLKPLNWRRISFSEWIYLKKARKEE